MNFRKTEIVDWHETNLDNCTLALSFVNININDVHRVTVYDEYAMKKLRNFVLRRIYTSRSVHPSLSDFVVRSYHYQCVFAIIMHRRFWLIETEVATNCCSLSSKRKVSISTSHCGRISKQLPICEGPTCILNSSFLFPVDVPALDNEVSIRTF